MITNKVYLVCTSGCLFLDCENELPKFHVFAGLNTFPPTKTAGLEKTISRFTCPKTAVHFTGSFQAVLFFADSSRKKGPSASQKPLFLHRSAKKKKNLSIRTRKRSAILGYVNWLNNCFKCERVLLTKANRKGVTICSKAPSISKSIFVKYKNALDLQFFQLRYCAYSFLYDL